MATVIRGDDNFDTSIGANVVQTHITTTSSQAIAAVSSIAITGLTATITPKFTASRIMVDVRWSGEATTPEHNLSMSILRDGSYVGNPSAAGNRITSLTMVPVSYHGDDQASTPTSVSFSYLDSPSTTATITYAVSLMNSSGAAYTVYNNRSINDTDNAGYERLTSSITLTEVQG